MVTAIVEQVAVEAAVNQEVNIVTCQWNQSYDFLHVKVRDNYLQAINNIQQADADVIYESQLAMNSSTRYVAYNVAKVINVVGLPLFIAISLPCMCLIENPFHKIRTE